MTSWRIIEGDCRDVLGTLDEGSVHTCVTSPPYFGLRDYGHTGQVGAERNLLEYIAALRDVFRHVWRVLSDSGSVWLNLGDSYGSDKSLMGVPWKVAMRLKQDGWLLRSDIIWAKPNPTPESVTDRPTKSHEYVFLLSKQSSYFYDANAIREPWVSGAGGAMGVGPRALDGNWQGQSGQSTNKERDDSNGRNKRSVWTVAIQPYAGAHFATFPPKLIEPCILAGCPEGGTVLDPFAGAGTTGLVALRHGRSFVGIELSAEYADLARWRIRDDAPLMNNHSEAAA